MIGFVANAALYVLPILFILMVVVTIHELGHFFAGKLCGVAMDRFSIGFGKAIWSRTDKSGVEWRVGWIPLGGYVRFLGDSNDASMPDAEDLAQLKAQIEEHYGADAVKNFYHFKPIWQRAIVAAAGPFANFVLAIAAFTCLLFFVGERVSPAVVYAVDPGSPAAAAGFMPGDRITAMAGHSVQEFSDVINIVTLRAGEQLKVDIVRNSEPRQLLVTPERKAQKDPDTGLTDNIGFIGLTTSGQASYHKDYSLPAAFVRSFSMMEERISSTITYIRRIISGRESGDQLSSVVGMGYATGKILKSAVHEAPNLRLQIAQVTVDMTLFLAMISTGIGFVNLLPIPVLDGGHLMFYAYEAVARRPAGPRLQAASYRVGLALVLCLMLFATWNDLHRMQVFKFLGGLLS